MSEVTSIVARAADVPPESLQRIERTLRAEYGGQEVSISRRAPISLESIDQRLRQRMPVVAIAADLGVGRATIYRHLKRKKS